MHFTSLVKCEHTPTDNLTSHLEANVDKINKAAIVGFKGLHLKELNTLEFSA